MSTGSMCFSVLQFPRICRVHNLAGFWNGGYRSLRRTDTHSGFKLLSSKTSASAIGGRHEKRWIRRPISTKPEVRSRTTQRNKSSSVRHEVAEGTAVSSNNILNINSTELSEFPKIQYVDTRQMIAENKDLAGLVTVVAFDIETTGLSRENERIIEIAIQDLAGGTNSTFQTLVNPGRYVANAHIHGISTHMVSRPDVPRMDELIPILLQYVKSRQKPGGCILWVAHNARCFDVPFLVREFARCNTEIPPDWLFVDTLALARELMKLEGMKLPSASLQALREHYKIELVGSPHRAMSDVNMLSLVLQRLTFDMKMTVSGLVERSFTPSELNSSRRKKKSSG